MPLPSLATPEFFTKIPSTQKEIKFRPFLVKEEKLLYIALESKNNKDIVNAVKQILHNCILDDIDIDELTSFDFEYLFLQLRGKSVGEVIELIVSHDPEKNDCKHKTPVAVNIEDIKVNVPEKNTKTVELTSDIGIELHYPNIEKLSNVTNIKTDEFDALIDVMASCIKKVYQGDEVITDFSHKEMKDWILTMNKTQRESIYDFIKDMPTITHKIEWTCPACGKNDFVEVRGLQGFFT